MYTTIDETFTQSFESGSKKNGTAVGIEASTTFHVLHLNQPETDWRPIGGALIVVGGVVLIAGTDGLAAPAGGSAVAAGMTMIVAAP